MSDAISNMRAFLTATSVGGAIDVEAYPGPEGFLSLDKWVIKKNARNCYLHMHIWDGPTISGFRRTMEDALGPVVRDLTEGCGSGRYPRVEVSFRHPVDVHLRRTFLVRGDVHTDADVFQQFLNRRTEKAPAYKIKDPHGFESPISHAEVENRSQALFIQENVGKNGMIHGLYNPDELYEWSKRSKKSPLSSREMKLPLRRLPNYLLRSSNASNAQTQTHRSHVDKLHALAFNKLREASVLRREADLVRSEAARFNRLAEASSKEEEADMLRSLANQRNRPRNRR